MNLKKTLTITYIFNPICILLLCCCVLTNAQSIKQDSTKTKDTLAIKQKYGLRFGADVSKLVRSYIDDDYTGFEVNGDIRFTKKWYLAAELGREEKYTTTDFVSNTASGNYFKIGGDYNMHENWLDMENLIYFGLRIGASSFSQTLNSYSVFTNDKYLNPPFSTKTPIKYDGLSALWAEVIFGIKAEIFNNLYIGLNVQLKRMLRQKQPENYQNIYVPGFNKTYDTSKFGAGFGYTISYLIPVLKRDKVSKKEKEDDEDNDN